MEAARTPAPIGLRYERAGSGRLLKLASDEALVARVRAGNERAFAVVYERHFRAILAFCRHMLGSREEAEDAVQQTFVSAYQGMLRDERELKLRPWLYRIARNQCISTLRSRRPQAALEGEQPSVTGLAEEVRGRGELRDLLADLARLPDDQREALVLAELHDNSHADVADILGCEREKVKSLVFQARSSLIKSRDARDLSCDDVRIQLSSLKGSALRRGALGRHLARCDGCRAFGAEVRRQRQQLAVLLAVMPTAALKLGAPTAAAAASAKLSSAGIGSATVAGSVSAAGAGSGAGGGSLAVVAAKLATPGIALKGLATATAVTVLAAGGAVGVQRVGDTVRHDRVDQTQDAGAGRAAGGATSAPAAGVARARAGGAERGRAAARHRFAVTPGRKHASSAHAGKPFSRPSRDGARGPGGRQGSKNAARGDPRRTGRSELGRRRAASRPERVRKAPARREPVPATDAPAEEPLPEAPDDGTLVAP